MTMRRLAAILAADVVGFSALMGRDEEGTHRRVKALKRDVIAPAVEQHRGRVVKTTGDGFLIEFGSPVEAVRCALAIQSKLADGPFQLRIGINLGDVIIEQDGDVYGDGVNVAARLEALCEPGSVLLSGKVYEEVEGKIEAVFESRGEQQVKNIAKPVRIFAHAPLGRPSPSPPHSKQSSEPSIAVLPFNNLTGDPDQEFFADGVVEDITTGLARVRWLVVTARNSSWSYKGQEVKAKQVGTELGVRYVLQGSVRRGGSRLRVTAQLVRTADSGHIWAERYDRDVHDLFAVQDEITSIVVAAIEPQLAAAEAYSTQRKQPSDLAAWSARCVHFPTSRI